MKYARLSPENTVIEVFTPPTPFALKDCFTPEIAAQFEPCPEEVDQNWIKQEDGSFGPPPPPPLPPEPPVEEQPTT